MNKNYFTLDEDFEKIIKISLKDKKISSLKPISTGWTNIVFEACTDSGNFFFRFPRDDFWSRTIVKDYEFSKFLRGKTSFNIAELELLYDNGRPFSMHKKIEGTVLVDKMNELTPDEIKQVSNEMAKFMHELHSIKFNKNEIFKVDNIGLNLIDYLDELINMHLFDEDKAFWKYNEFAKKDNTCLVHGDLNSSNVLLDENNHISAIIDFGFAGFGNKYFDIARITGRNCPEQIKSEIIHSYEQFSNENLDKNVLDTELNIWTDIDNGYINYMRSIGIYE